MSEGAQDVPLPRDIHGEAIVLEDERVLLRPLEERDVEHLLPFALSEPELWQHGLATAAGRDALEKYVATALDERAAKRAYPFVVFDKESNRYAGSTRFYDTQPKLGYTLLGYTWYGKAFQRTGLNRHCKFLLLDFAFEAWGLSRVEFRTDVLNTRSRTALRALGAVDEGVLRCHLPRLDPRQGRRDTAVSSILRSEWRAGGREALLADLSDRREGRSGAASS